MVYLISWRGRGGIVFLLIFLPIAFLFLFLTMGETVAFNTFFLGWLLSGVICLFLARLWRRNPAADDRFCTIPVKTWGIIFISIGVFFALMPLAQYLNYREMHKPIRVPPPAGS